ncbi:Gfo/Idh/MocA family protein [Streptomyces sp. NPDC001315]|uniref:Gfo/Idh/MocA family protein n=1 Tax=Streptomyces sp. NPDC001315 TaxID=3364562 RepID=UPI0036CE30FD
MSAVRGLGIVGWGAAGRLMAAAVARTGRFRLAGVADVSDAARTRAARETGCTVFTDVAGLAAAQDVDVLYVASPTAHHLSAVRTAAGHGKQVISEKPLAATLEDARAAVEAARAAGVVLLVGATHSSDAPVRALRRVAATGRLGRLLSVSSVCHTDWHTRPRSPANLDAGLGNGLVLRQGAHQLDILRYVCGGRAEWIFGMPFGGTGGTELGFSAQLGFADGVHASAYYDGTGAFDGRLLTWGVGELATFDIAPSPVLGKYFALPGRDDAGRVCPMFGATVATFSGGAAWVTPKGLLLREGQHVNEVLVDDEPSGWDAALAEMDAALDGQPPAHDGAWGVATLETCLALYESARTGAPVALRHQVGLPQALVSSTKENP